MTDQTLILAVKLGLGAFAVIMFSHFVLSDLRRGYVARGLLARWARKNGCQFVSLERKWFRLGPFWLRAGYAAIFRGVVLTSNGEQRAGYFRVGKLRGQIGSYGGFYEKEDPDPEEVTDDTWDSQICVIWDR